MQQDPYNHPLELRNSLEQIKQIFDFEIFRSEIEMSLELLSKLRNKSPTYDAVLIFKILFLQTLYNFSYSQLVFEIKDRSSFKRFLDLEFDQQVPNAKTIRLYREQLSKNGLLDKLFSSFFRERIG